MAKKVISIVIMAIIVCSSLQTAHAANTRPNYAPATTQKQQADEIAKMIGTYIPNGKLILELAAGIRSETTEALIFKWVKRNRSLYINMETAVRENYRAFQVMQPSAGDMYLVGEDIMTVAYPRENIIRTEEAALKIPTKMRTSGWRGTVSKSADSAANINGAYGLLQELSARYYGCMAVADCTDYLNEYMDKNGFNYNLAAGYLTSLWDGTQAFYELKYWTLEYLTMLKSNYPEQYKSIMDNTEYRKVFTYFNDAFVPLIEAAIPEKIKTIYEKIKELNVSVNENDRNVRLGNRSVSKKTADIERLKKEINGIKYAEILKELTYTPSPEPLPMPITPLPTLPGTPLPITPLPTLPGTPLPTLQPMPITPLPTLPGTPLPLPVPMPIEPLPMPVPPLTAVTANVYVSKDYKGAGGTTLNYVAISGGGVFTPKLVLANGVPDSAQPISGMLEAAKAGGNLVAAFTGTFFDAYSGTPKTYGSLYENSAVVNQGGYYAHLVYTTDNQWKILDRPGIVELGIENIVIGVSCDPRLIRNGVKSIEAGVEPESFITSTAQRTLVGVTTAGTLIVAEGVTNFNNAADTLLQLGCVDGMAMDGGASSFLYADGATLQQAGRNLNNIIAIYGTILTRNK